MKLSILFIAMFACPLSACAQGYENTMLFGYSGGAASPNDDDFGIDLLTFTEGALQIEADQNIGAFFNDTDAAISDSSGRLLFYFNGIDIFDRSHHVMQNGGLINKFSATGFDVPQGGLILPWPGNPGRYLLFNLDQAWFEYPDGWVLGGGTGCFYSVIDIQQNGGLGRVIERKTAVVTDTVEYGKLAVVRHANGRDWWLIVPELRSNRFYSVLIDPYGIHNLGLQTAGAVRDFPGIGQAVFSPDGTKYVMHNAIGQWVGYYVDVYDFDRCTGLLSNQEQMHFVDTLVRGVAIAPNSRWLYIAGGDKIFQYDLDAVPVASSGRLIAVVEPFSDPFPNTLLWAFLAPDNKIYVGNTGGSRSLHVIHRPDEAGTDCGFEARGVRLPCYNSSSLPTFANYRLGPLDGSSCDTLPLDNTPVSWWRYATDTADQLDVQFTDLSYHAPDSWSWDFGDGQSSIERHPRHLYAEAKTYPVCLTVSNAYGSNTHCQTLRPGLSGNAEPTTPKRFKCWPNPFGGQLYIAPDAELHNPAFGLYDLAGRKVLGVTLAGGINEIDAAQLDNGIYLAELSGPEGYVIRWKLVKTGK